MAIPSDWDTKMQPDPNSSALAIRKSLSDQRRVGSVPGKSFVKPGRVPTSGKDDLQATIPETPDMQGPTVPLHQLHADLGAHIPELDNPDMPGAPRRPLHEIHADLGRHLMDGGLSGPPVKHPSGGPLNRQRGKRASNGVMPDADEI